MPSPGGVVASRPVETPRVREDRALFERLADPRDPVDRELLVERFLPLARSLAARYARPPDAFEDVFQVACLGLVKAIDRFDLTRGRAFSSYAVPTIAGEIKRYYRDKTWSLHVPRDLQDLALSADRAVRELERDLGRTPTVAELADALQRTDEDVLDALHAVAAQRAESLDAPHGHPDDDRPATVADVTGADDDGFARAEQRAVLQSLQIVLTPRERRILALRFENDLTQLEIAELVGMSQMHVSRILRRAVDKLRHYAARREVAAELLVS
jgi:RNA polymerase sigma-B factor